MESIYLAIPARLFQQARDLGRPAVCRDWSGGCLSADGMTRFSMQPTSGCGVSGVFFIGAVPGVVDYSEFEPNERAEAYRQFAMAAVQMAQSGRREQETALYLAIATQWLRLAAIIRSRVDHPPYFQVT